MRTFDCCCFAYPHYARIFKSLVPFIPLFPSPLFSNDALDFADLVEYCWGDATTTSWGARRAADRGVPNPYNITVFEVGALSILMLSPRFPPILIYTPPPPPFFHSWAMSSTM